MPGHYGLIGRGSVSPNNAEPSGLGSVRNSSLEKIDKLRADEALKQEGAEALGRQALAEQQISENINAGPVGLPSQPPLPLGPGDQDLNTYLAQGIQNGTLAPQEAMAALEEPSVDPRIKQILGESLGEFSGLGGSVPVDVPFPDGSVGDADADFN